MGEKFGFGLFFCVVEIAAILFQPLCAWCDEIADGVSVFASRRPPERLQSEAGNETTEARCSWYDRSE